MIRHLKQEQIDQKKWDKLVSRSMNSNVFGYSWVLNNLFENWEALVMDDYEILMPFPVKKRFGLKWISNTFPGIYMGFYSAFPLSHELRQDFLRQLRQDFHYVRYPMNKYTPLSAGNNTEAMPCLASLDLIRSYPELERAFAAPALTAAAQHLPPSRIRSIRPNDLIQLGHRAGTTASRNQWGSQEKQVRLLLHHAIRYRYGQLLGFYSRSNMLSGGCLFLTGHRMTHLLFPVETEEGEKESALLQLILRFLMNNAGKNMILETSQKWFSEQPNPLTYFGGLSFQCPVYINNRLPVLFPWILRFVD